MFRYRLRTLLLLTILGPPAWRLGGRNRGVPGRDCSSQSRIQRHWNVGLHPMFRFTIRDVLWAKDGAKPTNNLP